MRQRTGLWPVLFLCVGFFSPAQARETNPATAAISIIIDDMGKRLEDGRRVLALPGPVACAFLPRASHTDFLARKANDLGKEVLLHLPMESVDGRRLDAGAVTLAMTERQFAATVENDLDSVPYAIGINNHMGSLLTRHPGHMLWLMRVMQRQAPLFFVDSRTTVDTVAQRIALENNVPNIERNVFLDNELSAEEIALQFERLVRLAKKQGTALAIGHPHPQTLALLEQRIPQLKARGIQLLPVRDLIDIQQQGENTWQASWSPSHRGAKNWKQSP
ncbi:MAG TPA: divergent polysaccharide deacetylase family protein [Gammaproteobacteria bacterium]|nr:divergent polysaccharide deacetylase family protein [Gammaproteobacteria bacterium]